MFFLTYLMKAVIVEHEGSVLVHDLPQPYKLKRTMCNCKDMDNIVVGLPDLVFFN